MPAFNAYLYNALEEMLEDNVQHVQIRTSLPTICRKMRDLGKGPFLYNIRVKGWVGGFGSTLCKKKKGRVV